MFKQELKTSHSLLLRVMGMSTLERKSFTLACVGLFVFINLSQN